MRTLEPLNFWIARPYESMTYPRFQSLLRQSGRNASVVAIGAKRGGLPLGLVLAEIDPDGMTAKVHSLFVTHSSRRKGIGTSLLRACEVALRDRGCRKVELVYVKGKGGAEGIEKVLRKLEWSSPRPSMLLCKASSEIARAAWLRPPGMPDHTRLFSWVNLAPEERIAIQRSQLSRPWYPTHLTPFREESLVEPANSIGLRHRGQVSGWMITHRIADDTVRYTSLFVRKEMRGRGFGLLLLAEAISRQLSLIGMDSFGVFGVYLDNKSMIRFVKRHMSPYLVSARETWGSAKNL